MITILSSNHTTRIPDHVRCKQKKWLNLVSKVKKIGAIFVSLDRNRFPVFELNNLLQNNFFFREKNILFHESFAFKNSNDISETHYCDTVITIIRLSKIRIATLLETPGNLWVSFYFTSIS